MSKSDFDYFMKFLNISVVYVPTLHAKYYGNEQKGVISSINLYDYSFKNNIEFGVFSETNLINNLTSSTDSDAWNTCWKIASESEAVFIKRPVFEKNILSVLLGKNYIKSDVLHDVTDKFYSNYGYAKKNVPIKKLTDFPETLELGSELSERPSREDIEGPKTGFCIRTGEKIPFNPNKPMTDRVLKKWAQFSNPDYPENYCHKTGRPSNGRTSLNHPIL